MSETKPGAFFTENYRIERVLGEGGYGQVLAARDLGTGGRVAIKVLKYGGDPVTVERFLREARAIARLEGPGVPRLYAMGRLPSGEHFMVMEYFEGTDLRRELLERGPLGVRDVVAAAREACDVLARAHAFGIVHRDVKSANLFRAVAADGARAIKVLDFGVARSQEPVERSLTRPAALLGSPRYMAPEQITDSRFVDERTDVWGLGATMFELLSGAHPFGGRTLLETISRVQFEEPQRLRELRPEVPPGLERVVLGCLEKDPARRFPNMQALAAALAPFADEEWSFGRAETMDAVPVLRARSPLPPSPSPPAAAPAALVALRIMAAAGALLVVIALALAVLLAGRRVASAPLEAKSAAPAPSMFAPPRAPAQPRGGRR